MIAKESTIKQRFLSHMAATMSQSLPSFFQITVKIDIISVYSNFYEKYIVTQGYCVFIQNFDCSLENCKFHILLIG